jgi:membrane fusion protein, heavy metal efflux system
MKRKNICLISLAAIPLMIGMGCKKHITTTEEQIPSKNVVILTDQQMKSIGLDSVRMMNEQSLLTLTGKVSFDEDKVSKVYPLASGNVLRVNVSLGDHVRKGQVLALLRSSEINDYQNQYTSANATLQLAKKNMENAEQLYNDHYYSLNQYLTAQNDYKHAQSEVSKIRQQLLIYGANPDKNDAEYKVIAPIDGYIVEKNISENMQVRADNTTNLFTVSYLNTVWVVGDVYETDLSKIHLGDKVDITTVAYPDKTFKGTIAKIGSLLDPVTKTLKIRAVLDNSNDMLKPEMFAVIKVYSTISERHIEVPTKSLVFDNSQYFVMLSKGHNTFERVPVKVIRTVGDRSYIEGTLKVGDMVVTDGSLLVSFSGL